MYWFLLLSRFNKMTLKLTGACDCASLSTGRVIWLNNTGDKRHCECQRDTISSCMMNVFFSAKQTPGYPALDDSPSIYEPLELMTRVNNAILRCSLSFSLPLSLSEPSRFKEAIIFAEWTFCFPSCLLRWLNWRMSMLLHGPSNDANVKASPRDEEQEKKERKESQQSVSSKLVNCFTTWLLKGLLTVDLLLNVKFRH